jgi:hypothetical protein
MAQQTQEQPTVYLTLYEKVLFFLVGLTIVTSGLSALENVGIFGLSDGVWRSGWLQNFSTEIFGAALTLVLIGRIIGAMRIRSSSPPSVLRTSPPEFRGELHRTLSGFAGIFMPIGEWVSRGSSPSPSRGGVGKIYPAR